MRISFIFCIILFEADQKILPSVRQKYEGNLYEGPLSNQMDGKMDGFKHSHRRRRFFGAIFGAVTTGLSLVAQAAEMAQTEKHHRDNMRQADRAYKQTDRHHNDLMRADRENLAHAKNVAIAEKKQHDANLALGEKIYHQTERHDANEYDRLNIQIEASERLALEEARRTANLWQDKETNDQIRHKDMLYTVNSVTLAVRENEQNTQIRHEISIENHRTLAYEQANHQSKLWNTKEQNDQIRQNDLLHTVIGVTGAVDRGEQNEQDRHDVRIEEARSLAYQKAQHLSHLWEAKEREDEIRQEELLDAINSVTFAVDTLMEITSDGNRYVINHLQKINDNISAGFDKMVGALDYQSWTKIDHKTKRYTTYFLTSFLNTTEIEVQTGYTRALLKDRISPQCLIDAAHCDAYRLSDFFDLVHFWITRSEKSSSNYQILMNDAYYYLTMFELLEPLTKLHDFEFQSQMKLFELKLFEVTASTGKPTWTDGQCLTFYGEVAKELCPDPEWGLWKENIPRQTCSSSCTETRTKKTFSRDSRTGGLTETKVEPCQFMPCGK